MPTLDDPQEAQIVAWFQIGLRREATRLAKKQKRLRDHELLILNELVSKEADEEGTEMLDTIPAPTDVCAEVKNALEMGVTRQAVNRIKLRALKRLKKYFVLDEPTGK